MKKYTQDRFILTPAKGKEGGMNFFSFSSRMKKKLKRIKNECYRIDEDGLY